MCINMTGKSKGEPAAISLWAGSLVHKQANMSDRLSTFALMYSMKKTHFSK